MPQKIKKNFKFWLNIFTLAALAFLIVISWDQIVEAFRELDGLNIWALLMMIPVQLISYYAVAKLYHSFFKSQGENVTFGTMYKVALELNFVNHVFPSGGVSGFSYLNLRLKQHGISGAKSTLAQILRFSMTFISFLALLVFGIIALSLSSSAGGFIILVTTTIIFATIVGVILGIYIISEPRRIKAFVSWLPKALNWLFRQLHIAKREIINIPKLENSLEDLHTDYVVLSKDTKLVKQLLKWALVLNLAEVLTVYLVYIAFGTLVNPGAVIIAYAVANFAGLIAVLPGGVGIYEGLMTATLASAGVPRGLALSATVIYRVLSMAFFLPIGYYFYHQALKQGSKELRELAEHGNESNLTDPDTQ